MKFQHLATGLMVLVRSSIERIVYEKLDGSSLRVEGMGELVTESGQRCAPASVGDLHDLLEIDVLTANGSVRLVRVD